tara:strand:+ start:1412 stop:2548 length:1137 start_codon:yes stop_codon:yes gene_type:complete
MSLSDSVYGSVATPRIWVDYIQYAKAIGYIDNMIANGVDYEVDGAGIVVLAPDAFDYNPVNMTKYIVKTTDDTVRYYVVFNNSTTPNKQFSHWLKTANYFGVLGHKIATQTNNGSVSVEASEGAEGVLGETSQDSQVSGIQSGIIGDPNVESSVGYSLYSLDDSLGISDVNRLIFKVKHSSNHIMNNFLDIGSFTYGRYFDFPHSANLQMNINEAFEGVRRKRTVGGSDITEILYTKPDWGDLPAWVNIETSNYNNSTDYLEYEDYRPVSNKSRRSWDLTFSYLSKEDTFPKTPTGTVAGQYLSQYDAIDTPVIGTKIKANLVTNFNAITLGGQIPFLFSPDKTKKDVCMCKLKSNGLSVQQSAPNLYTCQLAFEEVY